MEGHSLMAPHCSEIENHSVSWLTRRNEEDEEAATLEQGRRSDAEDHGAREDGDGYDRS
jgi:hypothetical protein